MVRENSEDSRASMAGEWGSIPQCPRNKKGEYGKNIKEQAV